MRVIVVLSTTRRPFASMYSKPLPRRRRVRPGALGSTRRRRAPSLGATVDSPGVAIVLADCPAAALPKREFRRGGRREILHQTHGAPSWAAPGGGWLK